ncbi:GtrA family protein [Roseovarius faecimaris]|uniref:GtrA family protein n=1 Tax=Roseovarius faecimaris TaxID=2494550 RepID=A0A6I6ITX5_9RHOB|nr:GtrA family protein [Roseovarius faecimaris]QGY00196.1 GtrA family protein [Roseovarius faecimaris]
MFHIFLVCSGCAAAVNICVGFVLYGLLGLDGFITYPISVALAFLAGMSVSFVLNRRFTYPPSGRTRRQELADFTGVSVIGLLLTTGMAHLLRWGATDTLEAIGSGVLMPETMAHVIAVGLTAIYSFLAHKYVSFRREEAVPAALDTTALRSGSGQ